MYDFWRLAIGYSNLGVLGWAKRDESLTSCVQAALSVSLGAFFNKIPHSTLVGLGRIRCRLPLI